MTGITLPPLRVLRTRVTFGVPFGNAELLRRALTRWKSLADDTRKPDHSIAAPFLDTGEIMGGISYVAQLGQLTLEVTKNDDTLVATMLALAADTFRGDSSGEIGIRGVGRDFEAFLPRSGPLPDVLSKFPTLTVDGYLPFVPRIDLVYAIGDTTLIVLAADRNDLRSPDESSDLFWINAIVAPRERLDSASMVNFLQAWPNHRTLMHHAVESILGIDHA